ADDDLGRPPLSLLHPADEGAQLRAGHQRRLLRGPARAPRRRPLRTGEGLPDRTVRGALPDAAQHERPRLGALPRLHAHGLPRRRRPRRDEEPLAELPLVRRRHRRPGGPRRGREEQADHGLGADLSLAGSARPLGLDAAPHHGPGARTPRDAPEIRPARSSDRPARANHLRLRCAHRSRTLELARWNPTMSLPPFHPFSPEYTANPRPYFAELHRHGRFVFVPEMNAVAVHAYDAVRAFCDHPQMSRNPADAGIEDPEQDAARMARWPTLQSQMKRSVAGDPQGLARMRELLAPDFKPAMIRKMSTTVQDVVEKVCAPLAWEREVDMVTLVQAVPLRVISKLLGIEEATADAELFLRAAPDYFRGMNPL